MWLINESYQSIGAVSMAIMAMAMACGNIVCRQYHELINNINGVMSIMA
jgi:hypothetical protein